MKSVLAMAAAVALAGPAMGAVFTDSIGDNFDTNAHMDIASVEVTNTATDITFKINLNGSISSPTDWGKYLVGISTGAGNGDFGSPVGNPWGRNIRMANGMDAFIGSWADSGGGFQPWVWTGTAWVQNGQFGTVFGPSSTSFTTSLASLGLSVGQTIEFDVYTTGGGGGDSANDALANASQTINDWQVPYTTQSGVSYAILVPEPATVGLAGLALVGLGARRRQRRA